MIESTSSTPNERPLSSRADQSPSSVMSRHREDGTSEFETTERGKAIPMNEAKSMATSVLESSTSSVAVDDLIWHHRMVDYSDGTSRLADLIWQRRWDEAKERLASTSFQHEISTQVHFPCFPMSDSLGLPLHLACVMRPLPPVSFIRVLMELHPVAAKTEETMWGMLPLHFAVRLDSSNRRQGRMAHHPASDDDDDDSDDAEDADLFHGWSSVNFSQRRGVSDQSKIIKMLINAYPDGLMAKERFHGMLPIHIAAATSGSFAGSITDSSYYVLNMLLTKCRESAFLEDDCGETAIQMSLREAAFHCHECRKSGHFVPSKHYYCPHVGASHMGRINPLLALGTPTKGVPGSVSVAKSTADVNTSMTRSESCSDEDSTVKATRDLYYTRNGITVDRKDDDSDMHETPDLESDDNLDDHFSLPTMPATKGDSSMMNRTIMDDDDSQLSDDSVSGNKHYRFGTISIKLRLTHLKRGKGTRSIKKWLQKQPVPFFELSCLDADKQEDDWTLLYRSQPRQPTKEGAIVWNVVEHKIDHIPPCVNPNTDNLRFKLSVFDCFKVGRKQKQKQHRIIGSAEIVGRNLLLSSHSMGLYPINRGTKVTGSLQILQFHLK